MKKRLRISIATALGIAVFFFLKDMFVKDTLSTKDILQSITAALITGVIIALIIWLIFPAAYRPKNNPGDL